MHAESPEVMTVAAVVLLTGPFVVVQTIDLCIAGADRYDSAGFALCAVAFGGVGLAAFIIGALHVPNILSGTLEVMGVLDDASSLVWHTEDGVEGPPWLALVVVGYLVYAVGAGWIVVVYQKAHE